MMARYELAIYKVWPVHPAAWAKSRGPFTSKKPVW